MSGLRTTRIGRQVSRAIHVAVLATVILAAVLASAVLVGRSLSIANGAVPTDGCPRRVSGQPPIKSVGGSAVLVPMASIRGARICRYFGVVPPRSSDPPFGLSSHKTVGRLTAISLARELDGLERVPKSPKNRTCPADLGGRLFIEFRYSAKRPPVSVKVFLSGCTVAVDDRTDTAFEVSRRLFNRLVNLTTGN